MGFSSIMKEVGKLIKDLNISFNTDGESRTIKASVSEKNSGVGANININKQPDTKSQINFSIMKENKIEEKKEDPDPIVDAVCSQ